MRVDGRWKKEEPGKGILSQYLVNAFTVAALWFFNFWGQSLFIFINLSIRFSIFFTNILVFLSLFLANHRTMEPQNLVFQFQPFTSTKYLSSSCNQFLSESYKNSPRNRQEFTESSRIIHQEFIKSSPRIHWEFTKNLPRIHREFTNNSQRIHQEFVKSSPRIHWEFTKTSLRIH